MENNEKKRYSVSVAGVPLNIITDESKDFLDSTAEELSAEIKAITSHSFTISKLDAAILCALDAKGEVAKSASRIRELEAQLTVLEMDMQSLREQHDALLDRCSPSKPFSPSEAEEKRRSIEQFLDRKVNE